MAVKVVLFGECSGAHNLAKPEAHRNFIKSSAVLRLGHYLRRRGNTVLQVHHFSSFTLDELKQLLNTHVDETTKMVGISTTFISPVKIKSKPEDSLAPFSESEAERIQFILETVKAISPNAIVIFGGAHITKLRFERPLDIERWQFDRFRPYIDYLVQEQGEVAMQMLINGQVPQYEVLNGFKLIDGGLLPVADFSENASSPAPVIDCINPGESLSTELAHGCIFNCEFCGHGRVLGKKVREFSRSYESLLKEITYNYQMFGSTMYMFLDDMVNDDPNKVDWLIKIKQETGIPLEWVSYARLDVIKTPEQAQKLLDAGCRGIYFGIESMKTSVGPLIGKVTDREKIIKSLKLIRAVFKDKVLVKVSMIAGLPTETKEEFAETIDWMLRSEEGQDLIDRVSISPLIVYREDKGSLTASRNYPFAQYVLDADQAAKYSGAANWTSPWGTRDEFAMLVRGIYFGTNPVFHFAHPFYFPMYHNFGILLEDYVRTYRDRSFTFTPLNQDIQERCKILVAEYKQKLLAVTTEQISQYHNEFWEHFPIVAEKRIIPIKNLI